MKKYALPMTLLFFVLCKGEVAKKATHPAVISFVAGNDAKIISSHGESKAAKGAILHESDRIQTGKKSLIDIVLPQNIVIRINENSTAEMKEFGIGEGKTQKDTVLLQRGTLFAKVAKLEKNSSFAVQTPTMVAGVRGTQFMTQSDEKGISKVAVLEGKVEVKSKSGEKKEVASGEQAQISDLGKVDAGKMDKATELKTKGLSAVTQIQEHDMLKFQNILEEQKSLIDKSGGRDKIKGMIDQNDQKLKDQAGHSTEKIGSAKAKTDSQIKELKAKPDAAVQENTQKVQQASQESQQKIDQMKNNNATEEAKKKAENLFGR